MSGIQWEQADKSDNKTQKENSSSVQRSAERRTSLTNRRRSSLGRRMKSPPNRNSEPQTPNVSKKEDASRSIVSPPPSMRRSMLEKSQFKSPPPLQRQDQEAQNLKTPQGTRQTPKRARSSSGKKGNASHTNTTPSSRKRKNSKSPAPKSRSPTPAKQKPKSQRPKSQTPKSNQFGTNVSRKAKEIATVSANGAKDCNILGKNVPTEKSDCRISKVDSANNETCDKGGATSGLETQVDYGNGKGTRKPKNPLTSPTLYSEPLCEEISQREEVDKEVQGNHCKNPPLYLKTNTNDSANDEVSDGDLNLRIPLSDSSQDPTSNKDRLLQETIPKQVTSAGENDKVEYVVTASTSVQQKTSNTSDSQMFSGDLDISQDGAIDQYMQDFCTQNALVAKTASPVLAKVFHDKNFGNKDQYALLSPAPHTHDATSNSQSDTTEDDLNQAVAMDTQNTPGKEAVSKEAKQLFASFTGN